MKKKSATPTPLPVEETKIGEIAINPAKDAAADDHLKKPIESANESSEDTRYVNDDVLIHAIDIPNGVGATVYVRRVREVHMAMRYMGISNLPQIMEFLGEEFYALTSGRPVTINGQAITAAGYDGNDPFKRLLLVIYDTIRQCYHVVEPDTWIIRDSDMGYTMMSDEKFQKLYKFTSTE